MKLLNKRNLKFIILFSFFTLSYLNLSAQRINGGFLGGLSTNQIDGDTQKDYKKLGLFSGVFVETNFTEVIGAKVELYYIGKGALKNVDGVEIFKTHLNYVEMPFLLRITPINDIELDIGLAFSYLISARMFEYAEEVPTSNINMHHFDFSGIVSGSYYFIENVAFNVRIDYSIVPVKNNPNWYNSNMSFGLIYRFN
ncbi:MAG: outer membrane beta-barrel protein [Bacteroidota bacterium]